LCGGAVVCGAGSALWARSGPRWAWCGVLVVASRRRAPGRSWRRRAGAARWRRRLLLQRRWWRSAASPGWGARGWGGLPPPFICAHGAGEAGGAAAGLLPPCGRRSGGSGTVVMAFPYLGPCGRLGRLLRGLRRGCRGGGPGSVGVAGSFVAWCHGGLPSAAASCGAGMAYATCAVGSDDCGYGELRAKALHRPRSRPAMSASSDVAPLVGGIVEEPLHLPSRLSLGLSG
jgi:hypothetical protein